MQFNFSIKKALKESWDIYKSKPGYFIVLALVMVVVNLIGERAPFFLALLVMVLAVLWSYIWLSSSLSAVDGKLDRLTFDSIKSHFPNVMQFLKLIGVSIIVGILVGFFIIVPVLYGVSLGLSPMPASGGSSLIFALALAVGGIVAVYLLVRLALANLALVDRHDGVFKTIRFAWDITKGKVFWTGLLIMMIVIVFSIIGSFLKGILMVVTYPLAMLLMAKFYRALTIYRGHDTAVAPQPKEIEAPDTQTAQ